MGDPSDVKARKSHSDYEISPDYFRISYDGAAYGEREGGRKELVGQGWEVDVEWDGAKFNPLAKTDHRTVIT